MNENSLAPTTSQYTNSLFSFSLVPPGKKEWGGVHSRSELGFNFEETLADWSIDGSAESKKLAQKDSLVYYPVGIEHYVKADNRRSRLKFNWSDKYLDLFMGQSKRPAALNRFHDYRQDPLLIALAKNIVTSIDGAGTFLDLQMDGYAQAILGRFLDHHNQLPTIQENRTEHGALSLAMDYAMENLSSPLTVSLLAEKAGLSTWYFSRLFKISIGEPPHRWLMKQRLLKALNLLRFSKLSTGEIAYECGFSHPAHLGNMIKKWTGRTPNQIRQG